MKLNRRRFVQMAGSASLLGAARGPLSWASAQASAPPPRFAYVGTGNAIHVYSIAADGRFLERQAIATERPVAMAIGRNHLYVLNGVSEFENLPRGSAQAFEIDPATGLLSLKNRTALSLSATAPRDLALAPDGRSLVVAVHGGGAYNVVPVQRDGRLGRVSGILKEVGSGPHATQSSARPSAVIFDPAGRALAADQGSDRLSVFSLQRGELSIASRAQVSAGSGPAEMALHPNARYLYVAHALRGVIESFAYDAATGRILHRQQAVSIRGGRESAILTMAMHPSGELLFSSHGDTLQVWKIATDGRLLPLREVPRVQATRLHLSGDGQNLLGLGGDAVVRFTIDLSCSNLTSAVKVASLSQPISILTA